MTEMSRRTTSFYTVQETAELLRVDAVTIYRSIRDGTFPAVKIRGRYVVPAQAIEEIAERAVGNLTCVDVADFVLQRRNPTG